MSVQAGDVNYEDEGPVISGSSFDHEIFDGSFGQFVADKLKQNDPDAIGHINAATGESLTNGEFLELSCKIYWGLKELGVKTGDLVVLSGESSHRNAAAATACAFANAPFAPIDPKLKPFELANIFESYQPRYLFCNEAQAESIHRALASLHMTIPIILFDKDESDDKRFIEFSYILKKEASPFEPSGVPNPAEDLAVVIPSSGSTGLPKGVALPHRTLNYACAKMTCHPWGRRGVFLQNSHLFWISGLFSLLGSYLGQTRVFLPVLLPHNILDAIKKYKPEMTFLSPSELTTLLKRPDLDPEALAPLRVIGTGGGPLHQFIVDQLKEKQTKPPMLAHAYGLTENAGAVTQFVPDGDILSVGKVDVGNHVMIADPVTDKVLKQGEIGEIRVKCDYQMVGYLGNAEATKAAFDKHGFLRTGDLGYFSPDLQLYITGRIKNLIKYRNMQISPEEIENLIIKMEGITDVGVDGIPNKEDQYHAVALAVKATDSKITEKDVQRHVEENMSEHNWLRGGVFFVEAIPRTAHKKTKRDELRKLANNLYNLRVINASTNCT